MGPAKDFVQRIHDVHATIRTHITLAKSEQAHYSNKTMRIKEFKINDMVLLSTQFLTLRTQPNKKLRQRFIGPYKIIEKISPVAYKLELPPEMKMHNVFHISMLREAPPTLDTEAMVRDILPAAQATLTDEDNLCHLEKILNHKIGEFKEYYPNGQCLLFEVQWDVPDTDPDKVSWNPWINIHRTDECREYIQTEAFRNFSKTEEYKKLYGQYPHRFPQPSE